MESSIVDSVTGIPLEMIRASKDNHVKISCATEKDNKVSDFQAVKYYKDDSLIGDKAASFRITQSAKSPYNAKEKFTLPGIKKETLNLQSSLGCRGNDFDCGFNSASIIYDKDNISSTKEAGENNSTQILNRSLFHGLARTENASTSMGKSSKPVTTFEFHAISVNGINIFVDLNASPSDLYKRLEDEICNCYCAQNNNKFPSLREELEQRFCMPKADTEKLMDNSHTEANSIERDSCNSMQFSDTVCQQQNASCSSPRESVLREVVPMLNLGKEHDESTVSRTGQCAEEQEHVNLVGGAETSGNFHLDMSLKEIPAVIVREKRRRPSSELNLRSRARSSQHGQRFLPRRSMRLVRSQGF